MRAGQIAQDNAESHYDDIHKQEKVYVDKKAQMQYENALAMGYSQQEALAMGRAALDRSKQEFETKV